MAIFILSCSENLKCYLVDHQLGEKQLYTAVSNQSKVHVSSFEPLGHNTRQLLCCVLKLHYYTIALSINWQQVKNNVPSSEHNEFPCQRTAKH